MKLKEQKINNKELQMINKKHFRLILYNKIKKNIQ